VLGFESLALFSNGGALPDPEPPHTQQTALPSETKAPPQEGFAQFLFAQSRFNLGRMVITLNANAILTSEEVRLALWRHSRGDWGDVCAEDAKMNEERVHQKGMILSAYQSAKGEKFWVITDPGHEVTTVLLPEDY
jgi:hypothetical protein